MTDDVSKARLASLLREHPAVKLAVLFGSTARGEAGPASDVDLAVLGDEIDRFALAADLSLALGREVDVVALDTDDLVLLSEIVRDGQPVLETAPGSFARFRARALTMLETDMPGVRMQQRAFVERVARHGLSRGGRG